MKKIFLIVGIFLSLNMQVLAVMMSLEECVKTAKKNSEELMVAYLETENVRNQMLQHRTGLLPNINLIADKTKSNSFDSQLKYDYTNKKYISQLEPVETERYDLKIYGEYKLLDLEFLAKQSSLKNQYFSAMSNYNQKKADLEFSVVKIYYNLILQEQLKNILEEEIVLFEKYLEDLKFNIEMQYSDKQMFLNSQINLQNKRHELYKLKKEYFELKTRFADLLAVPNNLGFNISNFEEIKQLKIANKDITNFDKLYEESELYRSDLEGLEYQLTSLTKEKNSLRNRLFMPELTARASYGYLDEQKFSTKAEDEYWTVSVQANWEIFSGLLRNLQKKNVDTKINIVDEKINKTKKEIKINLNKVAYNLENLYGAYKDADGNLEKLKKNLDEIEEKYRFKEATKEDLLSIKLSYNSAKKQYLETKIDLLIIEQEYDYILGRFNNIKKEK